MSKRLEGVTAFRVSAVVAVVVPLVLSLLARDVAVATVVGLAFAMAAATFCPLLVLGIWWRGLTDAGALAGLLVGGALTGRSPWSTTWSPTARRLVRRGARAAGGLDGAARLRDDGGRLPADAAPAAGPHLAVHGAAAHPGDGPARPRLTAPAPTVRRTSSTAWRSACPSGECLRGDVAPRSSSAATVTWITTSAEKGAHARANG